MTYTLLDSVTLGSSAASVTFSGISGTGKGDLVLIVESQTASFVSLNTQFNGDTASNYNYVRMQGFSSTASSFASSNGSDLFQGYLGQVNTIQIFDFAETNKHKSTLARSGGLDGVAGVAGRWANTAAITSIRVYASNFAAGSTFYLYQLVSE